MSRLNPENVVSGSFGRGAAELRSDGEGRAYWRPNAVDRVGAYYPMSQGMGNDGGCIDLRFGAAYIWGDNGDGEIGDGTRSWRSSPVSVVSDQTFAQVAGGGSHTLGLDADGACWAWGRNLSGQLGDDSAGSGTYKSTPVSVVTAQVFVQVSSLMLSSFGLTEGGGCWAWGDNTYGQAGDNTVALRSTPVSVCTAQRFIQVGRGSYHGLGLTDAGRCWCWGSNWYGEIGNNLGGADKHQSTPVSVVTAQTFAQVCGGGTSSYGLTGVGVVWSWGRSDYGQLGEDARANQSTPVSVCTGHRFIQIAAGYQHVLALTSEGAAWAWGYNNAGQCGDNTVVHRSVPVSVCTAERFIQVAVSAYTGYGLTAGGEVWAWGDGSYGQIGDGAKVNRSTPVMVVRTFW